MKHDKHDESLMLIKMLIVLVLFITLLMYSFMSEADYRHHDPVVNYYETTEISSVNNVDSAGGVALAIASYHPFDFLTNKLQGSINGATYDGETRVSFALAKRVNKTILFHTSYGNNNGKDALTLGGVWRFD